MIIEAPHQQGSIMGVVDKMIAAVAPDPTDEELQAARAKARAVAGTSGWLKLVLDHHLEVEDCFAAVKEANSATARRKAQKQLALVLTGHSIAEESVIYPAMALTDQKGNSGELYTEQSAAKVQMAALEDLDPMSQDYLDKLEHIRGAVAHHVCEEEGQYFVRLKETADSAMNAKLTRRYKEEYDRYVGAQSA
jgi:hemerythrin superfamily protein